MRPLTLHPTLFETLAGRRGEDLISVVIPTHEHGRDVTQDPIRLKNELASVAATLADRGWRQPAIQERLSTATALFDDVEFMEHQSTGLVVYIDEDGSTTAVSLNRTPQPTSFVLPMFHVRPLVTELRSETYDVLVATRHGVRLYESRGSELVAVDADLPSSFDDVNWFVDRERQNQRHPDRAGANVNLHGHRDSGATDEDTARFVRAIGRALPASSKTTPLVVLGDDRLVADLRAVIERPTTSPPHSGIADPDSTTEVRRTAGRTIEELEAARRTDLHDDFERMVGEGSAMTSIAVALPAALEGRLSRVAVHTDAAPVWGRFDPDRFEVDLSLTRRPGDVDLLDRVLVEGLHTGADVDTLDGEVAGSALVAALRYGEPER